MTIRIRVVNCETEIDGLEGLLSRAVDKVLAESRRFEIDTPTEKVEPLDDVEPQIKAPPPKPPAPAIAPKDPVEFRKECHKRALAFVGRYGQEKAKEQHEKLLAVYSSMSPDYRGLKDIPDTRLEQFIAELAAIGG